MSKKIEISEKEKEAILAFLSGKMDAAAQNALNGWLNRDPENHGLLGEFSAIWQASTVLGLHERFDANKAWRELSEKAIIGSHHVKHPNQFVTFLKVAAIVALAFVSGALAFYTFWGINMPSTENRQVVFTAPLGSRSSVVLSDGTKIWLNAGTNLKYDDGYGATNRLVTMEGEAFFEVAKNENLPFVVETADIRIRALGTSFNVKAYSEEGMVETTLVEGKVEVESLNHKMKQPVTMKPNDKLVFYKAGQPEEKTKPEENNQAAEVSRLPKINIEEKIDVKPPTSWKDQRWIIKNEQLGSLAVKLERRYNVTILFESEVLRQFAFGGTLEDESLEQVLNAISISAPVKFSVEKNMVLIKEDPSRMKKFKELLAE